MPQHRHAAVVRRMRPMNMREPYEGKKLEEFDAWRDQDDETVWVSLVVPSGTFTLGLTRREASALSGALKKAAS